MLKIFLFLILIYLFAAVFFPWENEPVQVSIDKNETYYNNLFCTGLGGDTEVKHYYKYGDKQSFVKVDCETNHYVYEGGLDKRSSLDSIQQAVFFSVLANKKPAVVVFDTDGIYGKYEHRLKIVADRLGIKFTWVKNESLGKN